MNRQLNPGESAVVHFDLHVFMVCTMRYAMGRQSYVVSEACHAIRNHWRDLSDMERQMMCRELRNELERAERAGRTLGHAFDDREWRSLLDFMEQEVTAH